MWEGIGSLVVITAAPAFLISIDTKARGFSYEGGDLPELDYTLDRLLLRRGSPFEAQASGRAIFAGAARLLGAGAAVATMLETFGSNGRASSRPDYSQANQCETCFRNAERDMRSRGATSFVGVERSSHEEHVSIMAGGRSSMSQATTQYRGIGAVPLRGDRGSSDNPVDNEPGGLLAASELLREMYPADENLAAHSLTAVDNRTADYRGTTARRIETPISTLVVSPTPSRDPRSGREFNAGTVFMHRKRDGSNPENMYWGGLYV